MLLCRYYSIYSGDVVERSWVEKNISHWHPAFSDSSTHPIPSPKAGQTMCIVPDFHNLLA